MPAQDEEAVIDQKWQALLSACSQPGADLRGPRSVSSSLRPTRLFPLENDCCVDTQPCSKPVPSRAVKCSGKTTHLEARQTWVRIPILIPPGRVH